MGINVKYILVLCCWTILAKQCTTVQESFIDIEKKESGPLPSCRWDYKYDVAKSVIAALCFFMGAFILVFGYKRRRISCMGNDSFGRLLATDTYKSADKCRRVRLIGTRTKTCTEESESDQYRK